MRDLDAELHEQYEQADDEARGAQLIQARIDVDIAAKLRSWRDTAHDLGAIV